MAFPPRALPPQKETVLICHSVRALQTNGTELSFTTTCLSDYDKNGQCDTFWYDSVADTTYALISTDSRNRDSDYTTDMQTFLSGMTTGELLFTGAANCGGGTSKSTVTVSNGAVNTDCLSSMKVCTWDQSPKKKGDWEPLFSDCGDFDGFAPIPRWTSMPDSGDGTSCMGTGPDIKGPPYFMAWRQYLGWGIVYDVAKANDIIFCANNNKYNK